MSTLSGAITNKIMTNTWLDSKISPKYTGSPCYRISIDWFIESGTISISRKCTYRALKILDNTVYYGLVDVKYVSGSKDTDYRATVDWKNVENLCCILNTFYLPIVYGSIGDIRRVIKFPVPNALDVTGGLSQGQYTLIQIQNAISPQNATIGSPAMPLLMLEKYICNVSNAGVEFEGNYMQYNGAPPSVSNGTFIDDELNSSNRAITDKHFTKIFTGVEGDTNRCIRQDIDVFTNVVFYPVIGDIYEIYNAPGHSSNKFPDSLSTDISDTSVFNTIKIVPPTFSGLDYWNFGDDSKLIPINLSLNRGGGSDIDCHITVNNEYTSAKLNAVDVAWNYTSGKNPYLLEGGGVLIPDDGILFQKFTINDNDVYGATLGYGSSNQKNSCIKLARNRKFYPGDIHGRNPYITPSILQDSTYKRYDIEYLHISDASRLYVHPTMNRSLSSSDGFVADSSGKAIIPVIYIPSTISFASVEGTCTVSLTHPSNSTPKISISLSADKKFYVYKYAYGNRTGVVNGNYLQRVKSSEIENLSEFISQLNSGAIFSGVVNYKLYYNGVGRSRQYPFKATPTFTCSSDSSGYLILTVNASAPQNVGLYDGQNTQYASIESSTVTMTSTGVDGFLVGAVSSTVRTTDTATIIWSGGSSGSSSAMLTNTIGDFDYE